MLGLNGIFEDYFQFEEDVELAEDVDDEPGMEVAENIGVGDVTDVAHFGVRVLQIIFLENQI